MDDCAFGGAKADLITLTLGCPVKCKCIAIFDESSRFTSIERDWLLTALFDRKLQERLGEDDVQTLKRCLCALMKNP
jgi:hypothetical protein